MHITQESDYAVRIIYCLAQNGGRMDARTIGEQMAVSLRFSLKILGKLSAAGLVNSFKGNGGGYELARPAKQVSLLDVIRAVEGEYCFSRCLEQESECCNRGASGACVFQNTFAKITAAVRQELAATNFDTLVQDARKLSK